jgi:chromatin remodeling complex protein RSC6
MKNMQVEETQTTQNTQSTENEETFVTILESMQEQVKSANKTIKFIKTNIKELFKLHKQELKKIDKKKKVRKGNNKSGINKPSEVPKPIRDLLDLEEDILMARTEVTKRIYGYIKENELQDPSDKRTIIPNNELKELFGLGDSDEVSFYNIQSYIKKLY